MVLILSGDRDLWEIVLLSLRVSVIAVLIAALLGMPLGAALAVGRFPGRRGVIILVNALMGLPPVVVGLLVYLCLSRSGPAARGARRCVLRVPPSDQMVDRPDASRRRQPEPRLRRWTMQTGTPRPTRIKSPLA